MADISVKQVFGKSVNVLSAARQIDCDGVCFFVTSRQEEQIAARLVNRLSKIPTGKKVLEGLKKYRMPVCFESSSGYGFYNAQKIVVNPRYSDDKVFSTLVHETRHMYQDKECGINYERNDLDLKSQIMNDRAKEADAQTWAIRASYELKTAGDAGPFNSFKSKSPEIFDEFQAGLAKSGGVLNKDVMTAAFMAWYDQTALRAQYEKSYMTDSAAMDVQRVVMSPVLKSGSPVYYDKRPLKSLTSEQLLTAYASNYFSGDKKALESDKCLSVSRATKGMMNYAFNLTGRCYVDKSLTNLPVTDMPIARQHVQEKEIAQENNRIYAAALAVVAKKTNLKEDTLKALLACGEKQRADILKKQRNPVLTNGVTCLLNLQKVNKHIVSPNNLMAAALVARQQQSR